MDIRLLRLLEFFRARGAAAVAFSGGVDSTLTLLAATRALGRRALGVFVRSEFASAADVRRVSEAAAFLERISGAHVVARGLRMLDAAPELRANPPERCYFCKTQALSAVRLTAEAAIGPGADVCDGTNADDDPARPGRRALAETGALSPLCACGLTKADVRELARTLGLPNADAPANSCLAARLPAGCAITPKRLSAVEDLETTAAALGLADVRARVVPDAAGAADRDAALLLVRPGQTEAAQNHAAELAERARELGFAAFRLGERT